MGVDTPAVTFGWFLSLFADALPVQTLLRVWDALLVYGPVVLFRYEITARMGNTLTAVSCQCRSRSLQDLRYRNSRRGVCECLLCADLKPDGSHIQCG